MHTRKRRTMRPTPNVEWHTTCGACAVDFRFLEIIGAQAHVVAICQPTVAALAAVALMAEDDHPLQPRTLTLMAGPIDARVNPTKVNKPMDLPAEFYLDTVQQIFQQYALATGSLEIAGRRIDPRAIRRTALLTVEGEKDDICSVGQTLAAQDLCVSVRSSMRMHHVQPGVGHFGVFSGRKWETGIYPLVRAITHQFG